jgi:hypothetical protein
LYGPSDRVLTVAQQTGAISYDIAGVELSHIGRRALQLRRFPWQRRASRPGLAGAALHEHP